jgi:tetratricopeptide (TPR) repeat protein
MKKISILGLCLVAALSASAQKSLVKEVEGKVKAYNADFSAARTSLKPALTNPESANDAQTWYVAGTVEFGEYDNLLGKKSVGQKADTEKMGHDLINGYDYFVKAFPMDSVVEVDKTGAPKVDKNGAVKVKTKYSKDMAKKLAAHHNDFLSGGQYLWDAKKYDDATRAWEIYLTLPGNKMLGADAPAALPDSVAGEISYFRALAAWQADKLDTATEAFDYAISKGYNKAELFDYAISVAALKATAAAGDSIAQEKANQKVVSYAKIANDLCGDTTVRYLNIIINDKINNRKYDEAQALLEKAISVSPNNAELYDVLGILYQSQNNLDKAQEYLAKAVALDPVFPKGQLDYGRVIYAQGAKIDEASSTLSNAEYSKVRTEKVEPLLREAIPYLENALNNESTANDARRMLRSIYYSLDDEANLKRIETM